MCFLSYTTFAPHLTYVFNQRHCQERYPFSSADLTNNVMANYLSHTNVLRSATRLRDVSVDDCISIKTSQSFLTLPLLGIPRNHGMSREDIPDMAGRQVPCVLSEVHHIWHTRCPYGILFQRLLTHNLSMHFCAQIVVPHAFTMQA